MRNHHGDGSDEQDKSILKLYIISNGRSISSILKIVSVKQWNNQILKLWEIQLCPGTRTFSLQCSTTPMIGCYWVFDQPSHNDVILYIVHVVFHPRSQQQHQQHQHHFPKKRLCHWHQSRYRSSDPVVSVWSPVPVWFFPPTRWLGRFWVQRTAWWCSTPGGTRGWNHQSSSLLNWGFMASKKAC